MKKILFLISILANVFYAAAQTTTLTFTGRDVYNNYIQLDRVLIADFAQGWQETIYYPDTTLTLSVMDTVPVLQRRWHPLPIGTTFTVYVVL